MKCGVLLASTAAALVVTKNEKVLGEITSLKCSAFLAKPGLSLMKTLLTSEENCSAARVFVMRPTDDWLALKNKKLQLP